MERQTAHLYAFVHPAFRWWLWLQLCIVRTWMIRNRRDVYIEVTRRGSVRILIAGDPPGTYRPATPARPHWTAPGWDRSANGIFDPVPGTAGAPGDAPGPGVACACLLAIGARAPACALAAPDTS